MSLSVTHGVGGSIELPETRSGHAAVFFRGTMIIYGGYNEAYVDGQRRDKFMPSNEIWLYEVDLGLWHRASTKWDAPELGISGAACCIFNNCMVLFGGFCDSYGRVSHVYELNLETLTWRDFAKNGCIRGPYPSKRDKLICWQHDNKVVYFGGFGPPPNNMVNGTNGDFNFDHEPWGYFEGVGWNSDVCVLDFSNQQEVRWLYPEILNEGPSPRAAHAGLKMGNRGYVFGGRDQSRRVNDMHYLDLDEYKWHRVTYNSPAPAGRSWHVLQKLSNSHLLLYGGLDTHGNALSDMWVFNIETGLWKEINSVHERLEGIKASRIWHTAVPTDAIGEVIIFGGCHNSVLSEEESCHTNSIVKFRSSPLTLERLCFSVILKYLPMIRNEKQIIPKYIEKKIHRHLLLEDDESSKHSTMQCTAACTVT